MLFPSKAKPFSNRSQGLSSLIDGTAFDNTWQDDHAIQSGGGDETPNSRLGNDVLHVIEDHGDDDRTISNILPERDPLDVRSNDVPQSSAGTGPSGGGRPIVVAPRGRIAVAAV